jgi:hypothetical protein
VYNLIRLSGGVCLIYFIVSYSARLIEHPNNLIDRKAFHLKLKCCVSTLGLFPRLIA